MSQENVEIVRRLTEAFVARDIEAFVAGHPPNAEVRNLRSQIVRCRQRHPLRPSQSSGLSLGRK